MSQTNTGHPKGLYVLFTTEMWERFNFYGMRAILSLFMAQALMMGEKDSSIIYGGFLGLCYLTPLLGGYIADKFLGNRICILLGGLLMAIGQFTLFAGEADAALRKPRWLTKSCSRRPFEGLVATMVNRSLPLAIC